MKWATLAILLLVILGSWFFYRSNHVTPSSSLGTEQNAMLNQETETSSSTPSTTGEKTFTIEGKDYAFLPSTITVNKGDKVKIVFQNTDGVHDFVIDQFRVATKTIREGQEDIVEFTADTAGTFEYYCSVGNHRLMGMAGTLIVK